MKIRLLSTKCAAFVGLVFWVVGGAANPVGPLISDGWTPVAGSQLVSLPERNTEGEQGSPDQINERLSIVEDEDETETQAQEGIEDQPQSRYDVAPPQKHEEHNAFVPSQSAQPQPHPNHQYQPTGLRAEVHHHPHHQHQPTDLRAEIHHHPHHQPNHNGPPQGHPEGHDLHHHPHHRDQNRPNHQNTQGNPFARNPVPSEQIRQKEHFEHQPVEQNHHQQGEEGLLLKEPETVDTEFNHNPEDGQEYVDHQVEDKYTNESSGAGEVTEQEQRQKYQSHQQTHQHPHQYRPHPFVSSEKQEEEKEPLIVYPEGTFSQTPTRQEPKIRPQSQASPPPNFPQPAPYPSRPAFLQPQNRPEQGPIKRERYPPPPPRNRRPPPGVLNRQQLPPPGLARQEPLLNYNPQGQPRQPLPPQAPPRNFDQNGEELPLPPPPPPPPGFQRRPRPRPRPRPSQGGSVLGSIGTRINNFGSSIKCAAEDAAANVKLNDRAFIKQQVQCVLDQGPCDDTGRSIKLLAPEVMKGRCPPPCDPCKQKQIQKIMATLSKEYSQEWGQILNQFNGKK